MWNVKNMTDDQLTEAMIIVRAVLETCKDIPQMQNKYMALREKIIEQMSQNCVREYQRLYGN
jgi:hypothetical protein